jgi:hypothetical protein
VNQIEQVVAPAPVYRGFAPRPTMPDIKLFHGYMAVVPEVDRPDFAALERRLDEPFVGITTDGTPRPGLFDQDEDEPGSVTASTASTATTATTATTASQAPTTTSAPPTTTEGPTTSEGPDRPGSPRFPRGPRGFPQRDPGYR